MEEGARIECFNLLNFFLGSRDLTEMDCRNISVHFAVRLVDTDHLDEAVGVLRVEGSIIKIIGDDDK